MDEQSFRDCGERGSRITESFKVLQVENRIDRRSLGKKGSANLTSSQKPTKGESPELLPMQPHMLCLFASLSGLRLRRA